MGAQSARLEDISSETRHLLVSMISCSWDFGEPSTASPRRQLPALQPPPLALLTGGAAGASPVQWARAHQHTPTAPLCSMFAIAERLDSSVPQHAAVRPCSPPGMPRTHGWPSTSGAVPSACRPAAWPCLPQHARDETFVHSRLQLILLNWEGLQEAMAPIVRPRIQESTAWYHAHAQAAKCRRLQGRAKAATSAC